MSSKVCYKCNTEKDIGEFGRNNKSKDGYSGICKKCDVIKSREYAEKNKEAVRNYQIQYNKLNKEAIKSQHRVYRQSEKWKAIKQNRYYLKNTWLQETDVTKDFLVNLKKDTKFCELCGCEMDNNGSKYPNGKQLDHILPFNAGGTHWTTNLRYICFKCNVTRPKNGSDLGDRIVYQYYKIITI